MVCGHPFIRQNPLASRRPVLPGAVSASLTSSFPRSKSPNVSPCLRDSPAVFPPRSWGLPAPLLFHLRLRLALPLPRVCLDLPGFLGPTSSSSLYVSLHAHLVPASEGWFRPISAPLDATRKALHSPHLPHPGLWTLEYKRELTTPLCIAAARGHTACVRHLLGRGADPDASPGGRGALHEACLGAHTACAQLLLRHGAHPDLPSAEGLAPLHCCRTAASLG